jgi:hypothetical protein
MDEQYYRRQIKGLIIILDDAEGMISTDYVKEKLNMILHCSTGSGFHPAIEYADLIKLLGLKEG